MNMIYSSLDKIPPHSPNAETISLTPTLASQRLLSALINDVLDTCEIDCTPSVQEFADKFIGEPVWLAEGTLMMELYQNMHRSIARKLAQKVSTGDDSLNPEIEAGYRLAYLMHKVMAQMCLGFGLLPFRDQMRENMMAAFDEIEAETAA